MKSNNKKIGILMAGACAAVLILTGNPCTAASGLSYDDFAPPANGGPTKVEAAVEKKGNVYKAQTPQAWHSFPSAPQAIVVTTIGTQHCFPREPLIHVPLSKRRSSW